MRRKLAPLFLERKNVLLEKIGDDEFIIGKIKSSEWFCIVSEMGWRNLRVCFDITVLNSKRNGAMSIGLVSDPSIRGKNTIINYQSAFGINGFSG